MSLLKEVKKTMKQLNNRGITLVEVIVTFSLVIIVVSGLLSLIMNYRRKAQDSFTILELQTYKDTLTKAIQDDILGLGLTEINFNGGCVSETNANRFASCANLVFKNGIEKILAISKIEQDNRDSLENKYIYYDDEKYVLKDSIPNKIPEGRHASEFQSIFMSDGNFVSVDSTLLVDGKEVKIYSIDIPIEHINYDDDFGLHIVASNADFLTATAMTSEFRYTGAAQEYLVPADGTYRIELWGASGGDIFPYYGGKGGYTDGYISLKKNQVLYFFVGGKGAKGTAGGFNGGGSLLSGQQSYGSSGGGATDVRLIGGAWDSFEGLKSRIMVASGGGGANYRNITSDNDKILYGSGNGGSGGGIRGYDGVSESYKTSENAGYTSYNSFSIGGGGTQTLGGITRTYNSNLELTSSTITGGFGKQSGTEGSQSSGGGGWYVGAYGRHGGAGGGSSYISGHIGCQAINSNSTLTSISHSANSEYPSYVFTNTTMIDGEGYLWTSAIQPTKKQTMPSNGVTTIEGGNVGDGYARITYLGL